MLLNRQIKRDNCDMKKITVYFYTKGERCNINDME